MYKFQKCLVISATFFVIQLVWANEAPSPTAPENTKIVHFKTCAAELLAARNARENIGPDLDQLAQSGSPERDLYRLWFHANHRMLEVISEARSRVKALKAQLDSRERYKLYEKDKTRNAKELEAVSMQIKIVESRQKRAVSRRNGLENSSNARLNLLLRSVPENANTAHTLGINKFNDEGVGDLNAAIANMNELLVSLSARKLELESLKSNIRENQQQAEKEFRDQIAKVDADAFNTLMQILTDFFDLAIRDSNDIPGRRKVDILISFASPHLYRNLGFYYGTKRLQVDPVVEKYLQQIRRNQSFYSAISLLAVENLKRYVLPHEKPSKFDVDVWLGILLHRFTSYEENNIIKFIYETIHDSDSGTKFFPAYREANNQILAVINDRIKTDPPYFDKLRSMKTELLNSYQHVIGSLAYLEH